MGADVVTVPKRSTIDVGMLTSWCMNNLGH